MMNYSEKDTVRVKTEEQSKEQKIAFWRSFWQEEEKVVWQKRQEEKVVGTKNQANPKSPFL
jgi:hypothetical protein